MGLQEGSSNSERAEAGRRANGMAAGGAGSAAALAESAADDGVRTLMLQRNSALFLAGETVHGCVYRVCSGGFKLYAGNKDGGRDVVAFRLPGDIFGLHAPHQSRYECDAVALEDSMVKAVAHGRLREGLPDFLSDLSRTLAREQAMSHLLRHANRERRLAGFLLELGKHQAQRGYSETVLRLPMSWRDISSYLGFTPEWASRSLLKLKQLGLLLVDGRQVHLLDPSALRTLAFTLSPPAGA